MIIDVTEEDIRLGTQRDGSSCPIARAILREGPDRVFVGTEDIELRIGELPTTQEGLVPFFKTYAILADAPLPKSATRFIAAFDAGKPVKPTRFRILGI